MKTALIILSLLGQSQKTINYDPTTIVLTQGMLRRADATNFYILACFEVRNSTGQLQPVSVECVPCFGPANATTINTVCKPAWQTANGY